MRYYFLIISIFLNMNLGFAGSVSAVENQIFGYSEIRSEQMQAFTKWLEMLDRHRNQPQGAVLQSGACKPNPLFRCKREEWRALLADMADRPLAEQLSAVNSFFNEAPYITDPINWNLADYWATPAEFFHKDGDCEDYAIAKYLTLKQLGVDAEAMRIVVLQDENLGVAHAVLMVETEGGRMILDNQITQVVHHEKIFHYRPIYSINETAWWLHNQK